MVPCNCFDKLRRVAHEGFLSLSCGANSPLEGRPHAFPLQAARDLFRQTRTTKDKSTHFFLLHVDRADGHLLKSAEFLYQPSQSYIATKQGIKY